MGVGKQAAGALSLGQSIQLVLLYGHSKGDGNEHWSMIVWVSGTCLSPWRTRWLNLTAASLPSSLIHGWISSTPHLVPRQYRHHSRPPPHVILHVTEQVEQKHWREGFGKLVNHFEKWVLYNVLNGNRLGLFLYLTPLSSPACSTILQSACGLNCEIQCCVVLIEWILSLQILHQ